jgi:hypothetical protein
MQSYFREHGFDGANQGLTKLPALPLTDLCQVKCKAGDCIICHYSLCHSIAPNISPNIRYMCYFRINVRSEGQHHPEPMLNIWTDFNQRFRLIDQASPQIKFDTSSSSNGIRPGYVDAMVRRQLSEQLAVDASLQRDRVEAETLFDQNKFAECADKMIRAADARPDELLLNFKAAVCCTVVEKERLQIGEQRLRSIVERCESIYHSFSFHH